MPVELPDVLSVMAHELRSPLSVLQGYIRLLQRQRDPRDPEVAMLTAMLDASARLTALGRQASDMAIWLRHDESHPDASATLSGFHDALLTRAPAGVSVAPIGADMATTELQSSDVSSLAAACLAVTQLAMRESAQSTAHVTLAVSGQDALLLRICTGQPSAGASGPVDQPVPFSRGGLGLALVMASYVLHANGATAATTKTFDTIDIHLRVTRGRAS